MEAPQKFLQAGAGDSAHVVELDAHTSPRIGVAHDTVDAHFSFGERKEEFYGCAGGRGHVGGDESTAGTQIAHARDAARSSACQETQIPVEVAMRGERRFSRDRAWLMSRYHT